VSNPARLVAYLVDVHKSNRATCQASHRLSAPFPPTELVRPLRGKYPPTLPVLLLSLPLGPAFSYSCSTTRKLALVAEATTPTRPGPPSYHTSSSVRSTRFGFSGVAELCRPACYARSALSYSSRLRCRRWWWRRAIRHRLRPTSRSYSRRMSGAWTTGQKTVLRGAYIDRSAELCLVLGSSG